MQKLIKKYILLFLLLSSIEILGAAILFLLHTFNYKHMAEVSIIVLVGVILLDALALIFALSRVMKAKQKNDVSTVEIVGEGIQEVYNFGQMGIMVVDDNDCIIWANEWFNNSRDKIIDQNIYQWNPDLIPLQDKNAEPIKIEIDNRVYSVKHIKDANLFIYKEITQLSTIEKYSADHAPVVGLIKIDDYQDNVSLDNEGKWNDIMSSLQKAIFDYAKKYGFLVRKIRSDSYSLVANYTQYERMIEDKISLLEDVRNISKEEGIDFTISVGIALGNNDYIKLNELASDAIDVCASRGGDQAVVEEYGKKLLFIGGKAEARSTRSQTMISHVAKNLETYMLEADRIFVMGHTTADLDAIGSCLGFYTIAKQLDKEVYLVYDEKLVEEKTKLAFKQMFTRDEIKAITMLPRDCLEKMTKESLLICTDFHKPSIAMAPNLIDACSKIAVIDHHRRDAETIENPVVNYIEPSASSASEICSDIIKHLDKRIIIPESVANMLLAGILLDTNHYRNKTSKLTYDASHFLKDFGADNLVASSFFKENYEEHELKIKIMATAETPYTGVVVYAYDDKDPIDRTMISIVAQDTLEVRGVNACFCIAKIGENTIGISARSDQSINVQYLLEKMGGGGHLAAAGGQIRDKSVKEVKEELMDILNEDLEQSRNRNIINKEKD